MNEKMHTLWTTGHGLYVLLGLLFIGIFISPITVANGYSSNLVVECIFAAVLIAGAYSTPCIPSLKIGTIIVTILAVIARILHTFYGSHFAVADNILAATTLIAFTILIADHFLLGKVLLRFRIAAAVAVYLILGVLFARLFQVVHLYNHEAFSAGAGDNPFNLVYFSFVTLMTLGYGDIVPVSMAARSLAMLEGIVGQLYMVILISSLVSEFSAQAIMKQK